MNTLLALRRLAAAAIFSLLISAPAAAQLSSAFSNQSAQPAFTAASAETVVADNGSATLNPAERILEELRRDENIPSDAPTLSRVEWDAYSDRLEAALEIEHTAINHSALRLIIAYGENLSLDQEAVFDVMRIYRDGDSERARRMAVVALSEMESDWALSFLERSSRFEKSETVKQTILAVLALAGDRSSSPL